jgi:hypothetical protein
MMHQYDYRPGPNRNSEFIKELFDRTNAQNAAIEKGWHDRREEERRRKLGPLPGPSPVAYRRQRSGGGGLFWLAALAFVGARLLHLF